MIQDNRTPVTQLNNFIYFKMLNIHIPMKHNSIKKKWRDFFNIVFINTEQNASRS